MRGFCQIFFVTISIKKCTQLFRDNLLVHLQLAYPSVLFGALVDLSGLLGQGLVRFDHLATHRCIDVTGSLHTLNGSEGSLLLHHLPLLRNIDVHHVAEGVLRVVGDPDRRDILGIDCHPLVVFREVKLARTNSKPTSKYQSEGSLLSVEKRGGNTSRTEHGECGDSGKVVCGVVFCQ